MSVGSLNIIEYQLVIFLLMPYFLKIYNGTLEIGCALLMCLFIG